MSLDEALSKDLSHNYVEAADLYELVIKEEDAPLHAFINLAVLYWDATDYGVSAGSGMPVSFFHKAAQRYDQVLQVAEDKFGEVPEVRFWYKYFRFISLGEAPFVAECKQLVEQPGAGSVPYFYLFMDSLGEEYYHQSLELYQECMVYMTIKNRYIVSVIESTARRKGLLLSHSSIAAEPTDD